MKKTWPKIEAIKTSGQPLAGGNLFTGVNEALLSPPIKT